VSGSTITGSTFFSSGITLGTSGNYASPLTITGSGGVTASGNYLVFGPNTQAWTVANYGTILNTVGRAVDFRLGGSVGNTGGLIEGAFGVYITGASGTITNSGTVIGTVNGIDLLTGGAVINTATGLIRGAGFGVATGLGNVTTVVNSGTIIGTTANGVALDAGGTVIDSGTIIGGGKYAISFGIYSTALTDRLVLDPGYRLGGIVYGPGTATNTLELGSTGSAGTVTAVLATEFQNFGTVTVDPGAQWTLTGNNSLTGITLTDFGTLTNAGILTGTGPLIVDPGTMFNTGSIGLEVTLAGGGVLDNLAGGTITAPGTAQYAVLFTDGGFLSNSSGGYIGSTGVGFQVAGGTVVNAGKIVDTAGDGVYIGNAAGTLTNSGTVIGANASAGVALNAGGRVFNTGAGLIQGGPAGVYIGGTSGTIVDSGTIVGSGGNAVRFAGSGNLLVVEQGYKLVGGDYGGTGATNTLELSGALGTVTATYNTLGLVNFQDVLFGASGNEILKATNTTGTLGAGTVTISGFTLANETIDLTGLVFAGNTSASFNSSTHVLTVTEGANAVSLLLGNASYAGVTWVAKSDGGTGTDITPACFCRGTLILSDRGEVAVEDLVIGDRLVTVSGAARRVKWIGHRAYDGRFIAANRGVLPIRVAADALAAGVPARDLLLSPEHALYLDGALVPAGQLVNGATIRQEESVARLEYFHIELEGHDVILAEGAPAETYVDCDNRFMFHNGAEFARLYPGDLPAPWDFCAPRAEEGSAELAAVRAALSERAAALGYDLGDTADRHPSADGEIMRAQPGVEDVHRFTRPAGARTLAVASGRMVPAEAKLAL